MDLMEQLLCPQISMDVEDTPLQLSKPVADETSDNEDGDLTLDDKLKLLLESECFDVAQTPLTLTEEEEAMKKKFFLAGPAVQFMKLHCTSCNKHLGSAPLNQFDRFIHPLLQVMQCKSCYEFYCSGEFDKDEDGSEMYCRWCGQGGKVMCCSECCYVFCQKCVRQNLGKRILENIKNSDDWRCFGCEPEQLMSLKIVCQALHQYCRKEIEIAKNENCPERLKLDHTYCCSKPVNPPVSKRKFSEDDKDSTYLPLDDSEQPPPAKKMMLLKKALRAFEPPEKPPPATASTAAAAAANQQQPKMKFRLVPRNSEGQGPAKKMPTILSGPPRIRAPFATNPNGKPILAKKSVATVPGISTGTVNHWFEQAATITNNVTANLTRRLAGFTIEQRNAHSLEQLANIHNRMQELLSSSVNSLIQVRKNLRTEFLNDLNRMKMNNSVRPTDKRPADHPPPLVKCTPLPSTSQSVTATTDDDVIIINADDEDPLALPGAAKSATKPPTRAAEVNGDLPPPPPLKAYIKVKPVSSLISSAASASRPQTPPPPAPPPPPTPPVVNGDSACNSAEEDPIDLCDDDDEVIMDEPTPPQEEKEKEEQPSEKVEEDGADLAGQDLATRIQIKRALMESSFEATIEENMKQALSDKSITSQQLRRMVTVRVVLAANYKPKHRFKQTAVPNYASEMIDVEDVLDTSCIPINRPMHTAEIEVVDSDSSDEPVEEPNDELQKNSEQSHENAEPVTINRSPLREEGISEGGGSELNENICDEDAPDNIGSEQLETISDEDPADKDRVEKAASNEADTEGPASEESKDALDNAIANDDEVDSGRISDNEKDSTVTNPDDVISDQTANGSNQSDDATSKQPDEEQEPNLMEELEDLNSVGESPSEVDQLVKSLENSLSEPLINTDSGIDVEAK